ncbi:hypothetical protein ADICYQ_0912 [Cyclobacterium qasimii M12-11B]|uniref:Uncharacterized protein n=1 Tax=Cyclobacterium qasimii M12-11B TaxID=641524 RepID=S7X2X3_9BACT|nr:hypothetical protein ADICYQ_0912 [Cyclobacterium qasimii M12-11B]
MLSILIFLKFQLTLYLIILEVTQVLGFIPLIISEFHFI